MDSKIYNYCLNLLSKRDYSIQKITEKLQSKLSDEVEVQAILDRLIKENFLNHGRYLEQRIETLSKKGFSLEYIQQKLHAEEIFKTKEDITEIQVSLNLDTKSIIKEILDKKLSEYINKKSTLTVIQLRSKALMFLSTKGYDYYESEDLLPTELTEDFN